MSCNQYTSVKHQLDHLEFYIFYGKISIYVSQSNSIIISSNEIGIFTDFDQIMIKTTTHNFDLNDPKSYVSILNKYKPLFLLQ